MESSREAKDALKARRGFAAVLLLACAVAAGAAAPAPLTTLRAIRALSNEQAAQNLPVAFEATVTYFADHEHHLFVQDGNDAIYIWATTPDHLAPGDRVLVRGSTRASFSPDIVSSDITYLHHGSLPPAVPANFAGLISAQYDARLVTVHGVVRSAEVEYNLNSAMNYTVVRLQIDGGQLDAYIKGGTTYIGDALLDAEITLTGVAGESFDGKLQQTGIQLNVSGFDYIKIVKMASTNPWALPATPMDQILRAYHVMDQSRRVLVRGTVTYYVPGAAVLQDGAKSIWVETLGGEPLQVGNRADAIGYPALREGFLSLSGAEIHGSNIVQPIQPYAATWTELASSKHIYDLVSIEGQVLMKVRETEQDEYVLLADGYLFSAIFRHENLSTATNLPPLKEAPIGSKVRVTGICNMNDANHFNRNAPFKILLRTPDDVAIMAPPPWWNVRHVTMLAGLLILLALAGGTRGWYLENKIRRQIGSLAYYEQRRSRILEAINASRPLSQIIEQITEMVSFKLNGAPCWCQISEGATLGNRPARLAPSLRTAEYPIASRSGPPLGTIHAAFDARIKPNDDEAEALAMASGLATLAIETYRLYSDLVHRSEFDLLTDVQNRFFMERLLETMIEKARKSAGIFGLIYIDLDDFKKVNDMHGHLVGDLYLQEAAHRMKHQLRPGDTLARLGGDEFAVLVADIHNRAEADEIAARMKSCFNAPFTGEGFVLHGSASVGVALYPEDAATADNLLSAADSAMYVAKKARAEKNQAPEIHPDNELAGKNRG
jgi:diguanylate cyclase (GGDEF)-like protein